MPTVDENIEVSITPKKIVVATPLKNGEPAPILTEETYNTLKGMLSSADEGNHKMAQLILNTCDIEQSIYWIWRLVREVGNWRMVNLRTKASRAFRDMSELFNIGSKAHLSFAEWLIQKDWMTPEIYQLLEQRILDTLTHQQRNKFYDVTITIKDEYKHLPFTTTSIKITHE